MQSARETTVFLLAAGFGKRMLPLTNNTPKPLLKVHGQALIEHHIRRLESLGFRHLLINVAHLGEQIIEQLGNGQNFGVEIEYSDERGNGPLETAGGIIKALTRIRSQNFITINADIYTDYPFLTLLQQIDAPAHLVLVPNPEHNLTGDFGISDSGLLVETNAHSSYTYCGIARYSKDLFSGLAEQERALAPLFREWARAQLVSAENYIGNWTDVGTPERLTELNRTEP